MRDRSTNLFDDIRLAIGLAALLLVPLIVLGVFAVSWLKHRGAGAPTPVEEVADGESAGSALVPSSR